MVNELPERLRAIAETVMEWDNQLCAKEDLNAAANLLEELSIFANVANKKISLQQAEIEKRGEAWSKAAIEVTDLTLEKEKLKAEIDQLKYWLTQVADWSDCKRTQDYINEKLGRKEGGEG